MSTLSECDSTSPKYHWCLYLMSLDVSFIVNSLKSIKTNTFLVFCL